jgi:hypothetical protein
LKHKLVFLYYAFFIVFVGYFFCYIFMYFDQMIKGNNSNYVSLFTKSDKSFGK